MFHHSIDGGMTPLDDQTADKRATSPISISNMWTPALTQRTESFDSINFMDSPGHRIFSVPDHFSAQPNIQQQQQQQHQIYSAPMHFSNDEVIYQQPSHLSPNGLTANFSQLYSPAQQQCFQQQQQQVFYPQLNSSQTQVHLPTDMLYPCYSQQSHDISAQDHSMMIQYPLSSVPALALPSLPTLDTTRPRLIKTKDLEQQRNQQKVCSNSSCQVALSPTWRRRKRDNARVCNSCGLYESLHGTDRVMVVNAQGQKVVKRKPRGTGKKARENKIREALTQQQQAVDYMMQFGGVRPNHAQRQQEHMQQLLQDQAAIDNLSQNTVVQPAADEMFNAIAPFQIYSQPTN
ncbi:hypothetical protein LPJ66_001827 [Kickxella alabastrina]|uniref:Uncharacterized protein n=1 Tax=Kickxella alabastrina TaxID=61397 RepID=A0ACC1ISF8_9FUNG|nr:hypothetical protein LPJ66_001827 [Kickxella alabastrina]